MRTILSAALLCATLAPSSAMALQEGRPLDARIMGVRAGRLTPYLVPDRNRDLEYCRYRTIWEAPDGLSSLEFELREQKALQHADCASNALADIETVLSLGAPCRGYDVRGRIRDIGYMTLDETLRGRHAGTVLYEGVNWPHSVMLYY